MIRVDPGIYLCMRIIIPGIISKEKYDAVQLERASRTNVELTEDGVKRKKTKYSSKKYRKLKKTIP